MELYLITIKTHNAMYEETVKAKSSTLAAKKVIKQLIAEGELSKDDSISWDWDFAD